MPSFWKLRALAHPNRMSTQHPNPATNHGLIAFVFGRRRFRKATPEIKSPTNGSQVAYRESSRTPMLLARNGSACVVKITKVSVAAFNPGVTDAAWNVEDVLSGSPVTDKTMALDTGILFSGVKVIV